MKTNYLLITIALLTGMTSCATRYRMVSRIDKDGTMYREVYAKADSAFMAGDRSHSPFPFLTDGNWQTERLDSAHTCDFWGATEKLNVKTARHYPSVGGELFTLAPAYGYTRPVMVPHERLEKRFRWFYTYYTYTADYQKIAEKLPVPLGRYLSREEQQLWLQGNDAAFRGLNGIELNERLSAIEDKFAQWCDRSLYEVNWEILFRFASHRQDTLHTALLQQWKEKVYRQYQQEGKHWEQEDPRSTARLFDTICHTDFYARLYEANRAEMDALLEQKMKLADLLCQTVQFELAMPGKLLAANTPFVGRDSAVWKVDGFRIMADDYLLTATSRSINYWAFVITLFAVFTLLIVCIRKLRR